MAAEFDPGAKSSRAQIETLLSMISASTRGAMEEYEKAGFSVPAPDSPVAHPSDSALDQVNVLIRKHLSILEGSCRKLVQTLAPPAHSLREHLLTPTEQPCLRVAVESGIADILTLSSDGMHVEEIAKKAPKRIEPQKLSRVIRFMASRGYFREVSHNVFANNRLSLALLSSNPLSSLLYVSTKIASKAFGFLPDALTDPDYGFSDEPNKAAFILAVRDTFTGGGFFDWLQQHPGDKERFATGMVGLNNVSTAGIHCPVWNELPEGASICDVGSGVGGFSVRLARVYPSFKVTLIDRPEVIDQAKEFWSSEYPQAIQEHRAKFVSADFLKEIPGGHDVYFARHVIHNWSDSTSLTILRNIKNAMRPDSRLFIEEYILPHSDTTQDKTPAGLTEEAFLTGSRRLYHLDIVMLSLLNAKERAMHEFDALGSKVGLKVINRWDLTETSLLEYAVADVQT